MSEDPNFEPFDFGRSLSTVLSRDLYTSPEVAIREMLSNVYDQYLHERASDSAHYMQAFIEINPVGKTLRVIDYATGIEDVDLFKMIGSNKSGKTLGTRTSTRATPDEDMIGLFHIGKASFPSISRKESGRVVKFDSNNGEEGIRLAMKKRLIEGGDFELGWDRDYNARFPSELAHLARKNGIAENGLGLSVEVEDVKEEFLKINRVKELVSKQFGLLMKLKGFHIFIRDSSIANTEWEEIDPPDDLIVDGRKKLTIDTSHSLLHCFSYIEKPNFENIDLYVKGVYITSFRLPYKVKGWLNDNKIRLIANREKPNLDDIYDAMRIKLTEYISANFEKEGQSRPPRIKGFKHLENMLRNMIGTVLSLYEQEPIVLSGVFDEHSNIRGQIETDPNRVGGWQKKPNMQLTKKGGDEEGQPIIPIGTERRKRKGRRKTGTDETAESILASAIEGGTHAALVGISTKDRPETGPIKPSLRIQQKDIGIDKPLTYMEAANLLYLNTDQPSTFGILHMPSKVQRESALAPFMAEAVAEFVTRFRDRSTNIDQYRQMVNDIYTRSFFGNE